MRHKKMINVGGFPVWRTTADRLTDTLDSHVNGNRKVALFYVNTNFVVRCRHLLQAMRREEVITVNDGVGVDIAVRLFGGYHFPENLAGSDFVPYFFSHISQPLRVYLVGSKPEVLKRAVRFTREHLGQHVVGYCDGYDGMRNTSALLECINRSGAQMVLVALGNPIQEDWILRNLDRMQCNIVMGVGALFDFWGGDKPRAPLIMRRLRLEWLFRLCLEPRRLMARYTVDFLRFLFLCHKFRRHPFNAYRGIS